MATKSNICINAIIEHHSDKRKEVKDGGVR